MTSSRCGRGAWPALLTFALLFGGAILFALVQGRYGHPDPTPDADLPPAGQEGLAGWRGSADLAFAGLSLRLTPLHAEPVRQAFDAGSLAERLGLDDSGEPWRLEVTWDPTDEAAAEPAALTALVQAIASGGPRLADSGGAFAAPLVAGAGADAPATLLALFDPARTFDSAARSGQVHLWGRLPGERLRLVAGDQELVLVPADFGRDEVPTFVARADGGAER